MIILVTHFLAAIAQHPENIEKIFTKSRSINKVGVYQVALCADGQWTIFGPSTVFDRKSSRCMLKSQQN